MPLVAQPATKQISKDPPRGRKQAGVAQNLRLLEAALIDKPRLIKCHCAQNKMPRYAASNGAHERRRLRQRVAQNVNDFFEFQFFRLLRVDALSGCFAQEKQADG